MCTAYPHLHYDRALCAAGVIRLDELRENACRTFFETMLVPCQRLHQLQLIPEERALVHELRSANAYPLPQLRSKHGNYSCQLWTITLLTIDYLSKSYLTLSDDLLRQE